MPWRTKKQAHLADFETTAVWPPVASPPSLEWPPTSWRPKKQAHLADFEAAAVWPPVVSPPSLAWPPTIWNVDVAIHIIQDSMVLSNIEPTHDDPDYLGKTATFPGSNADVTIPIIQDSMVLHISNQHMMILTI
jgi:hypothetical protein